VDENGIRSYRSRDICYVEDGLFYHVGRKDEQVKINGFRIEPSIVDFELSQLAGVSFSVTIDIPFNDRKILCTVIRSNLQEKEVLLYLKKHVPDYCLPKLFVRIDTETKLNVNGKIDKAFYRNYCVDHIKSR
jgi:acyl-CoA synthetase (AMP-forming)/AMP-acid ligase II